MNNKEEYLRIRIEVWLKHDFKKKCYSQGEDMSDRIRKLIKQWLTCLEVEGEADYISLKTALINLFKFDLFRFKVKDLNILGLPGSYEDDDLWDAVEQFNEVLRKLKIFRGYENVSGE